MAGTAAGTAAEKAPNPASDVAGLPRALPRLTPGAPSGAMDEGVAPNPPRPITGGRTPGWLNDSAAAVDAGVPRVLNPGSVGRIPA